MHLLHVIPKSWKEDLSEVKENIHNLIIQDDHIIRKHHMYFTIFLLLKRKNKLHQDSIIKRRSSAIAILTGKNFTY